MTDPVPSKDVSDLINHYPPYQGYKQGREVVEWGAATICMLLSEIERLQTALRGVQSCSTCEVCRGAATLALGDPLAAETRAATSRGAHSTEDAGRPRPSPEREPPHCSSCSCGMDPPQPEAIRALWNKAVIVQDGNRATVAFETAEEAETAFDYIHELGSVQPSPEPPAAPAPIPECMDLASRLNVVYNRLFIDCRPCEQEEAEILYEAIGALRASQPPGDGQ